MQPTIKIDGEYMTVPDAVKLFGEIRLKYVPANNSIQVRDGNVKYDYAFKTVSD